MKNKHKLYFIILISIFLVVLFLATFAGHSDLGFNLFKKMFNLNGDTESILLQELRFPRILKSFVAGVSLALSGMLLQSVSKNPLAEPYITGISSGAGFGIVISVLFFGGVSYSLFGFIGALISSCIVIMLCGFGKFSVTKLILIGLSVNMFASSIISFLILKNTDKSYSLMYILTGNISENSFVSIFSILVIFVILLICCAFVIPKLNFLRLDNKLLQNDKKYLVHYDSLIIFLSSFFAALSVLVAGILSFVGIIAPQLSKLIFGNDYRLMFFSNILIGASFILFSDFLSRVVLYPIQIPLGLVIAFIGSPIFIYFLIKKGVLNYD